MAPTIKNLATPEQIAVFRTAASKPARKSKMVGFESSRSSPDDDHTILSATIKIETLNVVLGMHRSAQWKHKRQLRASIVRLLNREMPDETIDQEWRDSIGHVVFVRVTSASTFLDRVNLHGGWKAAEDAFFAWLCAGAVVDGDGDLWVGGQPYDPESIGSWDDCVWEPWNPEGRVTCALDQERGKNGLRIKLYRRGLVSRSNNAPR